MIKQSSGDILDFWLKIEHHVIAKKLDFINDSDMIISEKDIFTSLHMMDKISLSDPSEQDKRFIIAVSSLIWEHVPENFKWINEFLIKILSRIEYSPSSIILDKDYDKVTNTYSTMKSAFSEAAIMVTQLKSQVHLNNQTYILSEFQQKVWTQLDEKKICGISAPTSAGKSFVILIKSIDLMLKHDCDIVYIVPTLSLVNQVLSDYNEILNKSNIKNVKTFSFYNNNIDCSENKIFIVTQEKLIDIFDNSEYKFTRKIILIVDEIQNIEHVQEDNEMRSKILYEVIKEFEYNNLTFRIIFSGARVREIDELSKQILNSNNAVKIETKTSPVLSITYSIIQKDKNFYLRQYVSEKKRPSEIAIINNEKIKVDTTRFNDKTYEYINRIVNSLKENTNIIFSPTTNQARKIAMNLNAQESNCNFDERLTQLIQYYEETVHKDYALCSVLKNRIAYHHGKMPQHVRKTVEIAMKQGYIQNLICTTTMIQGVNLPAQNIIIFNPNLFTRRSEDSKMLTSYEMANLRGRAGRLLKDFIGRTFVLDENSFINSEEYEEDNLFDDTEKTIECTYENKFAEYESEIMNALITSEITAAENQKYSYLIIYIRHTILNNPGLAQKRLSDVGINIDEEKILKISQNLSKLQVPKSVCTKNRYWDPIVLDKLYHDKRFETLLPSSASGKRISSNLVNILKILRDDENYGVYFRKQIPVKYARGATLRILCLHAEKWLKGQRLCEILANTKSSENKDVSELIDETIELLQNTVSYNMPLLLKPIYDILIKDSPFLSFMQSGSYDPTIRMLIDYGIPRETAIFLFENHLKYYENLTENDPEIVMNKLLEIKNELPFWISQQLLGFY